MRIFILLTLCFVLIGGCGGSGQNAGNPFEPCSDFPEDELPLCNPDDPWTPPVLSPPEVFVETLLTLVNEVRTAGYDCGSEGFFPPTRAVVWSEVLEAAGQNHANDMAENGFFSHTGSDGSTPTQRAIAAGYIPLALGENILFWGSNEEDAVRLWLASDPHCANLMDPEWIEMGVGRAVGDWPERNSRGWFWSMLLAYPADITTR